MRDPFRFFDAAFRKMDEAFAEMDKGFSEIPSKPSHGCICPPTSEKTCKGPMCPRRPIGETRP